MPRCIVNYDGSCDSIDQSVL